MNLRWLKTKRKAVTAQQVKDYSMKHECSLMEARTLLQGKQQEAVLQFLNSDGVWKDVPVVWKGAEE